MKRFVPLSIPNFNGNEKKYVDDALIQYCDPVTVLAVGTDQI